MGLEWSLVLEGKTMHPNYQFLVTKLGSNRSKIRVLDFGCGAGNFVREARTAGLDCYGADNFYEGMTLGEAQKSGFLGDYLRVIEEGKLPFPDEHFDFVVSNFVFEHVENLENAFSEIHRTLVSGGKLLALFTTESAVREGHVNMPFVHWMKPGSLRENYVLALRHLGFGREKNLELTPREWTTAKLRFLDQFTYYRSNTEVNDLLRSAGFLVEPLEDEFISFRLHRRLPFARQISQMLGATVIEATKS